jgi:hypothetical protein
MTNSIANPEEGSNYAACFFGARPNRPQSAQAINALFSQEMKN